MTKERCIKMKTIKHHQNHKFKVQQHAKKSIEPEIVLIAAISTLPPRAAERADLWVEAAFSLPLPRRLPGL
jgi:hypothetical protein